jgi:PAS domain S-box-containing protein
MQDSVPIRVLVVDDEKVIRDGCERALSDRGYEIEKAENGDEGIACLEGASFDIVLLDLMMPGIDGFSVLKWIKKNRPDTLVIVITGFATVAKAVSAMREGAFDFVGKPFTPDYIRLVVQRAAEKRALQAETERLREEHVIDLETIDKEQSRLKTVFACMDEAIIVTNRDGVVVLHNPAAIRMLDIQTDPVIGKHLSVSIRDQNAIAMIEEVVESGMSIAIEFPSGSISRLYLRARCAPVRTAGGKVVGSVTVFEDITPEKRLDQLKSEFVTMVVHELRAPLASVEQMIYAIDACGQGAADRKDHLLGRISVRIKDQLQLIENLLALSRMETGALTFSLEPIDGNEVLAEVIEVVGPRAESSGITLRFNPSPEEWWIDADRDQIRVVFTNIVDNAIKYTPSEGSVTVSSAIGSSLAEVRVADTGIGIPAENLPNIFDRFFRVKGKATRGITGSGLGLSLVKKVVEAHKGYIDVESEPDRGTTFVVSLPLAEPPQEV